MEEHMEESTSGKRPGRWIFRILFLVFLCMFAFSTYKVGSELMERKAAADTYRDLNIQVQSTRKEIAAPAVTAPAEKPAQQDKPLEPVISMDFTDLKAINTDIVAWIRGEGTNVDYPVLHGEDNDYYLNHLYNRQPNGSGSIFMDYRNVSITEDKSIILYGHHMKNRTMFQSIVEYKDQDFYDEYPTMMLYTPEGDYVIELFCGTVVDGNRGFAQFNFETDQEFLDYVDSFRSKSTFQSNVQVRAEDRIIALCTCSYEWENARYMLMGRLIPVMQ